MLILALKALHLCATDGMCHTFNNLLMFQFITLNLTCDRRDMEMNILTVLCLELT